MKPPELDPIPQNWLGVSLGFRALAYGLVASIYFLLCSSGAQSLTRDILTFLFPVTLLLSPFLVPFVAGFLAAYFWPHPEAKSYVNASWLSAWVFLGFFIIAVLIAGVLTVLYVAPFYILLDAPMSIRGGRLGEQFWHGRLGRQFLGDFSTDEWKEDGKNRF